MDHTFVAGLFALFDRSTLTELEFSDGNNRIRLSRASAGVAPPAADRHQATPQRPPEGVAATAPPESVPLREITAGIPGTFYRCPGPGQQPFVEVGQQVTEGQTIGIVEAMKTLNAIESEFEGVVVSFEVVDGTVVNVGDVLALMRPDHV